METDYRLPAERPVAALAVGEADATEHRDQPAQRRRPKVAVQDRHRAALDLAPEPGADDQIGAAPNRHQQVGESGHVVALIGVGDDDDVASGGHDAGPECGPVPPRRLLDEASAGRDGAFGAAIDRPVVDDDHLTDDARHGQPAKRLLDGRRDPLLLIQARQDHADEPDRAGVRTGDEERGALPAPHPTVFLSGRVGHANGRPSLLDHRRPPVGSVPGPGRAPKTLCLRCPFRRGCPPSGGV